MVSPKVLKIKETFDILKSKPLEIYSYSGDDFDLVFDITSADTFIAGIVGKIIDGRAVNKQDKEILEKTFSEESCWITTEGEKKSIEHLPEVLVYVQLIKKIQQLCLKEINGSP